MKFPVEPTVVPQARRYSRRFNADFGRSYQGNDVITIQIPPINNTYLTKNIRFHFDLDVGYYEASQQTWENIADRMHALGFDDVAINSVFGNVYTLSHGVGDYGWTGNILMQYVKPYPTLDINGPYGLFSRLQVFDYLGSTLLEDIPQHDVLTALLTDFEMDHENVAWKRPHISDFYQPHYEEGLSDYLPPLVTRKNPCVEFIKDPELLLKKPISLETYPAGIVDFTDHNAHPLKPAEVKNPTVHFSIGLYSFLHKLSEKFVPLHNGFTLKLHINKPEIPISFNTAFGGNRLIIRGGTLDQIHGCELDSTISTFKISSPYLYVDLVEVTPELDTQVEKIIHHQSFKYQQDFLPYSEFESGESEIYINKRNDFSRRILPSCNSVNAIFIGQRPATNNIYDQKLGYRVRNNISSSQLLYNKAEINSNHNNQEVYANLIDGIGKSLDHYLDQDDFNMDSNEFIPTSTCGEQYPFLTQQQRDNLSTFIKNEKDNPDALVQKNVAWFPGFGSMISNLGRYYDNLNIITGREGDFFAQGSFLQGKHLLYFDTRIPGTGPATISGIDTSRQVLEYVLKADTTKNCIKVMIDVFLQHDSFIHVDPGKTTSVTF